MVYWYYKQDTAARQLSGGGAKGALKMKNTIHFGYWQYSVISEEYGFVSLEQAPYTPKEEYYSRRWVKRYRKYMEDYSFDIQIA